MRSTNVILIIFAMSLLAIHGAGPRDRPPPDIGIKFDEYGYMPFSQEKKRLRNLAAQLKDEQQSGVKAYVYVFGGSGAHSGEAKARACIADDKMRFGSIC